MKNELLEIIQHYGVNAQQRQFAEEVFELQEAITEYEFMNYEIPATYLVDTKEPIAEEIADVLNIISEFVAYYELDEDEIYEMAYKKIVRQLERIKNEVKE